jgi:3-oxoacyl-[acyl-carrier protein] reductase
MSEARCAVVTGASRGIGKSIAVALAQAGYHVVGTATGPVGVESIEASLNENDAHGAALELDVTSDESLENFMSALEDRGLKPRVLVNNAGITRDNLLLRMNDEQWNEVIAANLTAVFKLSKRFVRPMLKARAGRIINISSVVGARLKVYLPSTASKCCLKCRPDDSVNPKK